jgi:diaminopimelate epimerase
MRSSRWQAQGNVYLVAEEPLTADRVRAEVGDADGILEVRDRGDDWVQIAVWNPDGSLAEMSGNGTRIAARWLAETTGATSVTVWVGPREVKAQMLGNGLVEQILGPVAVGEPEELDGVRFTPVDVGNPHAVVEGDPAELDRLGPLLETHPRFPGRTNVQVARRVDEHTIEARVWERGVGETGASGTSAIAIAAAFGADAVTVRFPGGDLHVRVEGARARLTGPAQRVEGVSLR